MQGLRFRYVWVSWKVRGLGSIAVPVQKKGLVVALLFTQTDFNLDQASLAKVGV